MGIEPTTRSLGRDRCRGTVELFRGILRRNDAEREAGKDRAWLAKVRPWWNHYYHFHVRLTCPPGAESCDGQKPVSGDDGCGQDLANWYAMLKKAAIELTKPALPEAQAPSGKTLLMADLPRECGTVLTSGGFEPPANADAMPPALLKAMSSKESGPPPPTLDRAARQAMIETSTPVTMPLPDRNPDR
jgi:penicillin-insensitive murein DD-endopeptidase